MVINFNALLHAFGPCAYFLLREFSAASPAWCYGLHGRPDSTGTALKQTRQIWGICIKQDETMSRNVAQERASWSTENLCAPWIGAFSIPKGVPSFEDFYFPIPVWLVNSGFCPPQLSSELNPKAKRLM